MSSTISEPQAPWGEPEPDGTAGALGCTVVLIGAAAISFGYLVLCLLVYGSRTDPFGATTVFAMIWIGLGLAVLVPTAVLGLGRRLLRHEWRAASTTAFAVGAAALLGVVAVGWRRVPVLESAWLLPTITVLVAFAAAVAIGRTIQRPAVASVLAVAVSGGLLGWGVESRLEVDIVWNPSPMRAAAADGILMFTASESGDYEVRLGDTGLAEGENTVVVCLRHGIASGEARTVVVADDVAPPMATIDIQPTTRIGGTGDHRTATTRSLKFSGTVGSMGRPRLEINGFALENVGAVVDVVDGRWSFEWTLRPTTDQAAFGVVVEDEAGNATRSEMIHVRFGGIDPPPVKLDEHPRLRVECRGEPALSDDECRAWATTTIVLRPELLTDAARLLLQLPNRFGSCSAESRGADDFTLILLAVACPKS